MQTVLGRKIRMTQVFKPDGTVVPVTQVQVDKKDIKQLTVGLPVIVTGTSKGKGFAGGVKRYSFAGGPKTRGQSDRHRAIGSIGAQGVKKVWKGKKMPGRMGNETVTIKGINIVEIIAEEGIIHIKGGLPGGPTSELYIKFEEEQVIELAGQDKKQLEEQEEFVEEKPESEETREDKEEEISNKSKTEKGKEEARDKGKEK